MEKKNSNQEQKIKSSPLEQRKKKESSKAIKNNNKDLPWWVELLFVQIGLPDKWLIKLLKTKKYGQEFYKNEKKIIISIFFFIIAIGYFQPVIKYSKTKIKCQNIAKSYILENTNISKSKESNLNMLSVNFCNGGNEIDNFKR